MPLRRGGIISLHSDPPELRLRFKADVAGVAVGEHLLELTLCLVRMIRGQRDTRVEDARIHQRLRILPAAPRGDGLLVEVLRIGVTLRVEGDGGHVGQSIAAVFRVKLLRSRQSELRFRLRRAEITPLRCDASQLQMPGHEVGTETELLRRREPHSQMHLGQLAVADGAVQPSDVPLGLLLQHVEVMGLCHDKHTLVEGNGLIETFFEAENASQNRLRERLRSRVRIAPRQGYRLAGVLFPLRQCVGHHVGPGDGNVGRQLGMLCEGQTRCLIEQRNRVRFALRHRCQDAEYPKTDHGDLTAAQRLGQFAGKQLCCFVLVGLKQARGPEHAQPGSLLGGSCRKLLEGLVRVCRQRVPVATVVEGTSLPIGVIRRPRRCRREERQQQRGDQQANPRYPHHFLHRRRPRRPRRGGSRARRAAC